MEKVVNINSTLFEVVKTYPEIIDIMKTLGFENIANPVMLNTVGKIMTIKKGSEMKKIDLKIIKEKFLEHGLALEDK
jgi:hypothetical protein